MGDVARARIELLLEEGDAVNPHVNPFIHANEPRLVVSTGKAGWCSNPALLKLGW